MNLFKSLAVAAPEVPTNEDLLAIRKPTDWFRVNLQHAMFCASQFGRNLLADVDICSPVLHSEFTIEHFVTEMAKARGFSAEFFSEPEYLFLPNIEQASETNCA